MTAEKQAEWWPWWVLICNGCDQIGMMRFRLKKQAMQAAEHMSYLGMTCLVQDKQNRVICKIQGCVISQPEPALVASEGTPF